jgi:hypothetical protein
VLGVSEGGGEGGPRRFWGEGGATRWREGGQVTKPSREKLKQRMRWRASSAALVHGFGDRSAARSTGGRPPASAGLRWRLIGRRGAGEAIGAPGISADWR